MTDKTLAERVAERISDNGWPQMAEFVLAADDVWPPDDSLSKQGASERRYNAALAALAKALGVE